MRDNSLEYLRLVRFCARLCIQILELDLLTPKIVVEATKLAAIILISAFIFKSMRLDALSHLRRVFIKNASHLGFSFLMAAVLCLLRVRNSGGKDGAPGELFRIAILALHD